MPDNYHSVQEPSEFEYDSMETDPEEPEDDPKEEMDDASVGSDLTYKSSGHDTDWTRRTNTMNWNQRCKQRKCKKNRGQCPTNAKKEEDRCKGKVVLSLFQDSLKEGALTYTDWCQEVEEYIRKGYDDNRVKDAMLSLAEGQAYVNFHSCDEGRNRTLAQILKEMDSIYNVSVTFRCSNWKNPPLEKTLPFTGAFDLWLQISNSEGVAQKNGYYHSLLRVRCMSLT